jgi:hypothetical protein
LPVFRYPFCGAHKQRERKLRVSQHNCRSPATPHNANKGKHNNSPQKTYAQFARTLFKNEFDRSDTFKQFVNIKTRDIEAVIALSLTFLLRFF